MGVNEFVQLFSSAAAGALVASVWQTALLAGLISIGLKLSPKTTASARFLIWAFGFAASASLPLLFVSPWEHVANTTQAATSGGSAALHLDSRCAIVLAAVWLALSMARAVGLFQNASRLRRLWKAATPFSGQMALRALALQGMRRASLCTAPGIDQPCVIGFFSPRILVPDWLLAEATPEDVERILLHEAEHLRRLDDWTNLLQKVVLVFFPLNPALLWMEKRLCAERERACDESVVHKTNAPYEYATSLANLAEQRLERRPVALSLGAWEKKSELAARIESILGGGAKLGAGATRLMMAGFFFAIGIGAIKLAESSQLVNFEAPLPGYATTESGQASVPKSAIHNVVFHEPPSRKPQLQPAVFNDHVAIASSMKVPQRAVRRHPAQARSVAAQDTALESWIVFTSYEDPAGQRTTVTLIHRLIPTSTPAAAQPQVGWYVIPL